MTLIEFVCAAGFFGFLVVQLLILVMIGLLSRRITKLERQDIPNHTHWKDSSRNRPDKQSWND